jgi:hypothetical protein
MSDDQLNKLLKLMFEIDNMSYDVGRLYSSSGSPARIRPSRFDGFVYDICVIIMDEERHWPREFVAKREEFLLGELSQSAFLLYIRTSRFWL